jgi:isopentenyldiphosphate isomerase
VTLICRSSRPRASACVFCLPGPWNGHCVQTDFSLFLSVGGAMDGPMGKNEEMIEEWDWDRACPTGRAVPRSLAHKMGIAHEGVHLWVIRGGVNGSEVLFQQRARSKEMYPDCLDITVGGHVVFGMDERKIQKESYEEIGIDPDDSDLVDLGLFRYEEITDALFHREFQRVYLLRDERDLAGYSFTDGEVEGIYAVPAGALRKLFDRDFVFAVEGYDGIRKLSRNVTRSDFHPLLFAPSMKAYMEVLFRAIAELMEGGGVVTGMPSPL